MNIIVTLNPSTTSPGPFNIYYDVVGDLYLLAKNVSTSQLISGFNLTNVPDNASTILVQNENPGCKGNVVSYSLPTTTTTSTTTTTTTAAPTTTSTTTSTTTANVATMNVTYTYSGNGGPTFNVSLSKALSTTIRIQNLLVDEYTTVGCTGSPVANAQITIGNNPYTINSGNTFAVIPATETGTWVPPTTPAYVTIGSVSNPGSIEIDPGTGTFTNVPIGGTILIGSTTVTVNASQCSSSF